MEFVERDMDNMDDYLFNINSQYQSARSAQNFNTVDAIFAEGDSSILPWHQKAYKLRVLLQMCIQTNKRLYASQCALQTIVYLSSVNTEKQLKIVQKPKNTDFSVQQGQIQLKTYLEEDPVNQHPNSQFKDSVRLSNGKFQRDSSEDYDSMNSLEQILEQQGEQGNDEVTYLINKITGDLYKYDIYKKQYLVWGNIGLHNQKSVEEKSLEIGQYMLKPPQYIAKGLRENQRYLTGLKESLCQIKPHFFHHYIFKNIDKKYFLIQKNSNWEIHPNKLKNLSVKLITLSENKVGPQVLEISESIIGCSFPVKKNYFQSQALLKNFIDQQVQNFLEYDDAHYSPLKFENVYQVKSLETNYVNNYNINQNNNSVSNKGQKRPQSQNKYNRKQHYNSINNDDKNSFLRSESQSKDQKQQWKLGSQFYSGEIMKSVDNYISDYNHSQMSVTEIDEPKKIGKNSIIQVSNQEQNMLDKYMFDNNFNRMMINKSLQKQGSSRVFNDISIKNNKKTYTNNDESFSQNISSMKDVSQLEDLEAISQQRLPLSKSEIKQYLHPKLQVDKKEKMFIPGYMSSNVYDKSKSKIVVKMQKYGGQSDKSRNQRILSLQNTYASGNYTKNIKLNKDNFMQRNRVTSLHQSKTKGINNYTTQMVNTKEQLPYGQNNFGMSGNQNSNTEVVYQNERELENTINKELKESNQFQLPASQRIDKNTQNQMYITNKGDKSYVKSNNITQKTNRIKSYSNDRPQSSGSYMSVNLSAYKYRNVSKKQWVGGAWKKF